LAQKAVQRVTRAGFPVDLIPDGITSVTVIPGIDAENTLRTAVLEFIDIVRGVEKAIAAGRRGDGIGAELDVAPAGTITEDEWRACWPVVDGAESEFALAADEVAGETADSDADVEN